MSSSLATSPVFLFVFFSLQTKWKNGTKNPPCDLRLCQCSADTHTSSLTLHLSQSFISDGARVSELFISRLMPNKFKVVPIIKFDVHAPGCTRRPICLSLWACGCSQTLSYPQRFPQIPDSICSTCSPESYSTYALGRTYAVFPVVTARARVGWGLDNFIQCGKNAGDFHSLRGGKCISVLAVLRVYLHILNICLKTQIICIQTQLPV